MQSVLDQYTLIVTQIEEEKRTYWDSLFSSIVEEFSDSKNIHNEEEQGADYDEWYNSDMLALLCLKIKYICQLLNLGDESYKSELKGAITDLTQFIGQIEFVEDETAGLLAHAEEILYLICPEGKVLLSPCFRVAYHSNSRYINGIDVDFDYLVTVTAEALARVGYLDNALFLLENFCSLSAERNTVVDHQELVVRVLAIVFELSPSAVIPIAKNNSKYFDELTNEYTGDYYWFYGCALQQAEKISEATAAFEKCYHSRKLIRGELDWYTMIAKREYATLLFSASAGKYGRDILFEFINMLAEGKISSIDENTVKPIEGKTLYILLQDQSHVKDWDEYNRLLTIFEGICDTCYPSTEPFLQRRLAKNLRGGFLMQTGNYILAESVLREALEITLPDGVGEVISDNQIKINLLLLYYVQNDMEMAIPLLLELIDALERERDDIGIPEKDKYRIYTILIGIKLLNMVELDVGEVDNLKGFLAKSCDDIIHFSDSLPACRNEMAVYITNVILLLLQNECVTKDDLYLCLAALERIGREHAMFPINELQRGILLYATALVSWTVGGNDTEKYFEECIDIAKTESFPQSIEAAIMQNAAIYSAKKQNWHIALLNTAISLNCIESLWRSYISYLNDARLLQILMPIQRQFSIAYAMLRKITDVGAVYESLLRFKAIASLAGRERNRILRLHNTDSELYVKIRKLQNDIAIAEVSNAFRGSDEGYEASKLNLKRLEAKFVEEFPHNLEFTEITWNKVKEAIPDNSVVIEYFYTATSYGRLPFEDEQEDYKTCFDIYIIQKVNGCVHLFRVTAMDGERLLKEADEFVRILQAESSNLAELEDIEKLDDIRAFLYKKLVLPILPYLDGCEKIYIAPDTLLSNLPFEILYDEEQNRLLDRAYIVKIECARDFLFLHKENGDLQKEDLIIGNPKYELREYELGQQRDNDSGRHRSLHLEADHIRELPFSEIEVQRVSNYCGNAYYIGYKASKKLLFRNRRYRNIHIATHGYFDFSGDSESKLFTSCLLFAGSSNWLKTGRTSDLFENGILTDDEVSRLDFRDTELVVLSSCMSGMNGTVINKGLHGMLGAFSASGVHYVISHLWEANDFSTAVFMDAFYYEYIENKKIPPVALALAKKYLRNVTIGELKKRKWFELIKEKKIDFNNQQLVYKYETMDDSIRPFKNEAYWGGFACYQCCL